MDKQIPKEMVEEAGGLMNQFFVYHKKDDTSWDDVYKLARQILSLIPQKDCKTCEKILEISALVHPATPSPDRVREILIRHFEPVDVDDKVDFAYSLVQAIKEICGG